MSYEYTYGDVLRDKGGYDLYVRGVYENKVLLAWIDAEGKPAAVNFHKGEPKWAEYVMRGDERVYPEPELPEFEFGDKVVYKTTPQSEAFFIKYIKDSNSALVAFNDPDAEPCTQEVVARRLVPA